MSFNFAISSDSAVRNSRRPLTPWEIHDVKFKGAEIREFNGKKDPNAHYKLLSIKYENEDGYFNVDLFFPKDGDDVRPEFDGANGGKVQMASSFETTMAIVKQTAQVLNPKGFEQMQKLSVKFKSFDDVAKTFIKVTTPAIDTDIKIKLTGKNRDGKVVAQIPRILALNKEGEAFICDNYIGPKLFWSDYEVGKRDEYLKSTPTDPDKAVEDTAGVDEAPKDDLDLDSLL